MCSYACHIAPWGNQAEDQTEYMHWYASWQSLIAIRANGFDSKLACIRNGNFGALLFINHWEYTQDLKVAQSLTYPLLSGLNAWWGCFLTRVNTSDSYVYMDSSAADPDQEHENQNCVRACARCDTTTVATTV